jgi:CBS domain-containing protein
MSNSSWGAPSEPEFVDPLTCYDPPEYRDEVEAALAELPVEQIQMSPLSMIDADDRVSDAVSQLADYHIACLMVMEGDRLVGVFTERDVLMKLADCYEGWSDRPVREFMTPAPVTILENDRVSTAICVLAVQGYRHVPVLDDDRSVVGIVSPNRVLDFLQRRLTSC